MACQGSRAPMRDALFAYEPLIRLGVFVGVFVVMAGWEVFTPRRLQTVGRNWRWPNNLGVLAVDALLVRVVLPITTIGLDRKSTRLNSSHLGISYAVFCLK